MFKVTSFRRHNEIIKSQKLKALAYEVVSYTD